jgi:hypothetical protein
VSTAQFILALIGAVFAGGGLWNVFIKRMSKPVDDATAAKIVAEAKVTATEASAGDIQNLRNIIVEVRQSAADAAAASVAREERAYASAREVEARLSEKIEALMERIGKLEERERHALTRAAVHEAWDQLALQFVLQHDKNFPPPPPLSDRALPPGTSTDPY